MNDETLAEWLVHTCLVYGASIGTAYQVAGLFVAAIDSTRGKK